MEVMPKVSLCSCWYVNLCVLLFVMTKMQCNQFDPHVLPEKGPFFEGWYVRLTDFNAEMTLGVLFGHVLPRDGVLQEPNSSLALVSILHRDGKMGEPLKSHHALLNFDQIHVTVKDGQPVTKNPDDISPADFTWAADNVGYIKVHPISTEFNFTAGHWRFSGVLGKPVPWGIHGEGPEGWLSKLPLPLHWFVYSLRSPVIQYELLDLQTNKSFSGRNGVAHMEKNWGKSFPKAWIWSEVTTSQNMSLALSGGLVTFDGLITVPAYLIGYRNPSRGISLNFRPVDSVVKVTHDGCQGIASIVAEGIAYLLEVNITASTTSFSNCLYGPEEKGFEKACVESYDAMASAVVKKRHFWKTEIVDKEMFKNVALEFGGKYVCRNKCNPP